MFIHYSLYFAAARAARFAGLRRYSGDHADRRMNSWSGLQYLANPCLDEANLPEAVDGNRLKTANSSYSAPKSRQAQNT